MRKVIEHIYCDCCGQEIKSKARFAIQLRITKENGELDLDETKKDVCNSCNLSIRQLFKEGKNVPF